MAEFTPLMTVAITEMQRKQDIQRLNWHKRNNEYLQEHAQRVQATAAACLEHVRLRQQKQQDQTKEMLRSADPFGRFERLASACDVMFPVRHPDEMHKSDGLGSIPDYNSRSTYLKDRLSLDPSEKYAIPPTSSMRYGWLVKEKSNLLYSVMSSKHSTGGRRHYFR